MNNVHLSIYKKQELTRLPEICKGALQKAWGRSWNWIKNHSDKLIAAAVAAIAIGIFIGSCIGFSFAPLNPFAAFSFVVGATVVGPVLLGIAIEILFPRQPVTITQKQADILILTGDYKKCGRTLIAVSRERTRQVRLGRGWVTVSESKPGMRACGNYRISG